MDHVTELATRVVMPAATLPSGVVLLGELCDEPCGHRECATGWQIADSFCGLDCGEPIGFGQRFVEDPGHGVVHADCWADRFESPPVAYGTPLGERIEARA